MIRHFLLAVSITTFFQPIFIETQLVLQGFPEFMSYNNLSKKDPTTLVFNKKQEYMLEKQEVSEDRYIMSINYYPGTINVLSKAISKNQQVISYTDIKTPFICYQWMVYPKMPFAQEFYTIAQYFKLGQTKGLTKILRRMNSVAWNKPMLDYFYSNVQSHRFYKFAKEKEDSVWEYYRTWMSSWSFFDPSYFSRTLDIYIPEDVNTKAGLIVDNMRNDLKQMLSYLYDQIKDERNYNVNGRHTPLKNYRTNQITHDKQKEYITVQTFDQLIHQVIEENLANLTAVLVNPSLESENFAQEDKLLLDYRTEIISFFHQESYFWGNYILNKLRSAEVDGNGVYVLREFNKLYQSISFMNGRKTVEREFIKIIFEEFLYDKIEMHAFQKTKDSRFIREVNKALKSILNAINVHLKQIPNGDSEETQRIKDFLVRQMVKKYFDRTPNLILLILEFVGSVQEYVSKFTLTPIYLKYFQKKGYSNIFEKICNVMKYLGVAIGTTENTFTFKFRMFELSNQMRRLI